MALINFVGKDFSRREVVTIALCVPSVGLMSSGPVLAQGRKLFGIKIPTELEAILPPEALGIAETVDAILILERDADLKNLPASILSSGKEQPIAASDGSIYELALPRLVALIDRSEFRDNIIAEKAGGLLAGLHSRQRTVPEGLLAFAGVRTSLEAGDGRTFIDAQSAATSPTGFDLPELSEPAASIPPPETLPVTVPDPLPVPFPETLPETLPTEIPTEKPNEIPATPEPEAIPPPEPAPEPDKPLSRRRDFASLPDEYEQLFASATLRPERSTTTDWHLKMLLNSRTL